MSELYPEEADVTKRGRKKKNIEMNIVSTQPVPPVPSVPKKRGRKKKVIEGDIDEETGETGDIEVKEEVETEPNVDILNFEMADFKIEDSKETRNVENRIEEVTQGINELSIDTDRNERREKKVEMRKKYRFKEMNKDEKDEDKMYYMYLFGKNSTSDRIKYPEDVFNRKVFMYQLFIFAQYENELIVHMNLDEKRKDIEWEDEITIIKDKIHLKIRLMKNDLTQIQKMELTVGRWKMFMMQYFRPRQGILKRNEIFDKLLMREVKYVEGPFGMDTLVVDNTMTLNKPIYLVEGETLIRSEFVLRDVIEGLNGFYKRIENEDEDL